MMFIELLNEPLAPLGPADIALLKALLLPPPAKAELCALLKPFMLAEWALAKALEKPPPAKAPLVAELIPAGRT